MFIENNRKVVTKRGKKEGYDVKKISVQHPPTYAMT
jgi:hypothetical protein